MAPQRVLKSLNNGSGTKRFVFKSFAKRVEEVDVDVFRSLAPVKFEPTSGSSFFHENLLRWRELNAAADFNAVYVELLPVVQTLPQLLLHKDAIVKSLISRVRLDALLSLEPILSLIAILSRDLREEFLPYMSKFLEACSDMLKAGGDQEPDLLEQVFVSISYVIKYLMKFLARDILFVLRVTKTLRYYHRTFVQDFIAESVSYLLRKAPPRQLVKGVRSLFAEVEADFCEMKTASCCTLLFHTLKGPVSGLHSQAESLLHLLFDKTALSGLEKKRHGDGGKVAVQVVSRTLLMLCENIKREKLETLWFCLVEHISGELSGSSCPSLPHDDPEEVMDDASRALFQDEPSDNGLGSTSGLEEIIHILQDKSLSNSSGPGPPNKMPEETAVHLNEPQAENDQVHLVHLLSLLTDVLEFRKGSRVNDYSPLFGLVPRLLQPEVLAGKQAEVVYCPAGPLAPLRLFQDWISEFSSEVLRFLLALVRSHSQVAGASKGPGSIAALAPTWAVAFNCNRVNCLLPFLRGLIDQDVTLVRIFTPDIIRSLDLLIEDYAVDALPLLFDLSQKLESVALLSIIPKTNHLKSYIINLIQESMKQFKRGGLHHNSSNSGDYIETLALDPAVVWMALKCIPSIVWVGVEEASLSWKYAAAVECFLSPSEASAAREENEDISRVWECLLATALSSNTQIFTRGDRQSLVQHVDNYLNLAVVHKKSSHILKAVGEFLDALPKDTFQEDASSRLFSLIEALGPNLCLPEKNLRTVSLKLLSYFELCQTSLQVDKSPAKRQKGNNGQMTKTEGSLSCESFQQLLAVESSVLAHDNFRQSSVLITAVKVTACAGKIPDYYVVPLVNALIGVLHNRFSLLWDSVMEALAGMLDIHRNAVGQVLLSHLEITQNSFLHQGASDRQEVTKDIEWAPKDIWARFDAYSHDKLEGTQIGTLLTLHLRTLQKVANFSEARSRQLIPLFLTFVGHSDASEELHESVLRGGKDWKVALKEWLNVIKEMRNARSLFKGPVVKDTLVNRFLSDSDPVIQLVTLQALLNWKDKYLTDYEEHLKNLISSKALREELTTWDVSKDSHLIQDDDREPLLAVVLLILFPKIMRRTIKSMGRSGAGVQRNAVLSFLARLESRELAPLFIQLMQPLDSAFRDHPVAKGQQRLKGSWMPMIKEGVSSQFIEQVDTRSVAALPYKRKLGFLHMVMDSLEIFNHMQMTPYLFALLAIVLRLLETCAVCSKGEASASIESSGVCEEDPSAEGTAYHLKGIAKPDLENTGEVPTISECDRANRSAIYSNGNEELSVLGSVQLVASQADNAICSDAGLHSFSEYENFPCLSLKDKEGIKVDGAAVYHESMLLDEELRQDEQKDDSILLDVGNTIPKVKIGGVREIRTLCFRILATVIRKFENVDFPPLYWDIFYHATKQSVGRFVAENSFTGSPSALMQCFMAMSQRMELAPLLARDLALVPNILSILAVKGASPAVVSAVLNFVENILDLVSGHKEDESVEVVRSVLLPHLDILLSSFGDYLSFYGGTASERRSLKRELQILTRVSKYIGDTAVAAKLQNVLLPMLKVKRKMDQAVCLEVLHLLQGIGPNLQISAVIKCLPTLALLLVSVRFQDVRIAISETLVALAKVDHTLLNVAELIADLNSMSTTTIDEFDYTRRLLAYDQLSGTQFPLLTRAQALLVLSHVIFDMGSEDMSIRHRASDCLQKYVQFAASLPEDSDEVCRHKAEGSAQADDDLILNTVKDEDQSMKEVPKALKALVPNFLLPHVRNGMGSNLLVVRREWVLLLREMAANFACGTALKEYHCLLSNDLEADFFLNIVHLQVHRRIKAIAKFKVICSSSHFSQGSLSRIFVPLFMNLLLEARGDKEGNLVTVSVEALACIAAKLLWEPYFSLLMRSFHLLSLKPDHQKVLVRVICAILDAFHFFCPLNGNENANAHSETRSERSANDDRGNRGYPPPDSEDQVPSHQSVVAQLPPDVLSMLQKRVLPEIRQLMVSKVGIVSTSVALTQVKILKLMPGNIVEVELPQVVRIVINALKSRSQAVRDEARAALVAITESLGAKYLHFIVDVLQSSLTKGFELHVLGYTLNSILVKLVPNLKVGEIDYCLEQILEVLENDIMGAVADEKDVEAVAVKMKETKHMRSFESIKLLAQVVTFQTQAMTLLGPVRRNLQRTLAPKVKPKLEIILQQTALGLLHNKSVTQSDLLVIVYAMVEDGVKEEKTVALAAAAKKQTRIDKIGTVSVCTEDNLPTAKAPTPHFYLITEYALQLLHSHLKRVKVNPRDGDTLAMLNPLVGLLQECLNSKYDRILVSALKNFSLLLLLPLPAVELHGSKITTLVFSICQRFVKAENSLLQACLNVLMILIRQCRSLRLSEDQLRALLQFPIFTDLEGGSRMALSLLKAIVSRKLLVPELYDMMNRVAQLMVTSYVAPVRQICSQILLQFLLDYPLGKKRLQQHLDFFITNVGYAQSAGREAALEMLHTVILKFPRGAIIEEHLDSMFFPLVTRLVNDESNQVRLMIGTILKVLMGHLGPQSLQRMVDFAISWYKGADQRLWRTAAQVLGFFIEVMGKNFGRYAQDVLPRCIQILEQANFPQDGEGLESDQIENPIYWQDAYFSLTMMEKFLQQLPNMILHQDLKKFWMLVSSLLLHRHIWIRKVCGRMLSIYFSACGVPDSQRLGAAAVGDGDILFFHPSWILLLVASLCQQLDSGAIDDAMGEQLLKILEVIGTLLLPESVGPKSFEKPSFLRCDDLESQERVSRALHLLGWEDRSQNSASVLAQIGKANLVVENENGQCVPSFVDEATNFSALSLVFKKLQKIALRVHPIQTKVILRWYAAMAPRLGKIDIEQYLQSMLIVLTKITEGTAAKVVPEDVKALGDEVLTQLRELIGATKFVNAYNSVRQKGKENREKRKIIQKISVLVDPERHTKRKIKMTSKRQAQKKRKIIKEKIQMGL